MSLTPCPDCGRSISSAAPACIHCGRPAGQQTPTANAAPPAAVCPLCGAGIVHPNARIGGTAWCERCGGQLVYGQGGVLVRAVPRAPQPRPVAQVVVVGERKSVGVAVLLAFFFGPLGMLYATVGGAVVMFLVTFFVALVTFGFGVLLTWPIGVLWAAYAAGEHNRRMTYGVNVLR